MKKNSLAPLTPIILIFTLVTALALFFSKPLEAKGVNTIVVVAGNLLMFLVIFISFKITTSTLNNDNPNAFVRGIYGSFMVKLFVIAIAAFAYIIINKKQVNKPAIFVCLGLYVVYTALEVAALMRLLRRKSHE